MRKFFMSFLIIGGLTFIARAGIEFLNPEYWNPKSFIDYLAVILTSIQDIIFALVLLTMLKLEPIKKEFWRIGWGLAIGLAGAGSLVAGVGNFLEDAIRLSEIGNAMYSYGGMMGGIALMVAFVFALPIQDIRNRWAWFYLLPLIGAILFADFGGFITGFAMIILAGIEIRGQRTQKKAG